ncbi:hypothetical protein FOA52_010025 [Chlamydomonas sp. UWO 241]|nr:hypothetical protein FOA52_010025 [Chlamydomonas sp. UWO 241]
MTSEGWGRSGGVVQSARRAGGENAKHTLLEQAAAAEEGLAPVVSAAEAAGDAGASGGDGGDDMAHADAHATPGGGDDDDAGPPGDGAQADPSHVDDVSEAAAAPAPAAEPDHGKSRSGGGGASLLPVILVSAAVAGGAYLCRRFLKKVPAAAATGAPGGASKPGRARGGRGAGSVGKGGDASAAAQAAPAPAPVPVEEPSAPDQLDLLLPVDAILPPLPLALGMPSFPPPPLSGIRIVVGEDVDIEGVASTAGVAAWREATAPAASTAPALMMALGAGALCLGKTSTQPLSLDLLGANVGCPTNRSRCAGGGATGAAAALATGLAELALVSDSAGEGRGAAACCGVSAFRPTPGLVPPLSIDAVDGGIARLPQLLSSPCVLAAREELLLSAAAALRLPGDANLRGEIIKFVVAQDLFDLCAPELQPATVAVKKAILRWAGADQAGAVQLIRFLATNTSAWQHIPVKPPSGDDGEIRFGGFVEAVIAATQALRIEDLHRRHAGLQPLLPSDSPTAPEPSAAADSEEAEGAAAASEAGADASAEASGKAGSGAGAGAGAEIVEIAGHGAEPGAGRGSGSGDEPAPEPEPSFADRLASAASGVLPKRPSQAAVDAALQLQREVSEVLRQTVKPDTIMVLPALPFPPPKRTADDVEADVFSRLVQAFSSIASLGCTPCVTCPIGNLRDGSPVAISLFGVAKFDLRLVAVAQKLIPMIRESFQAVKDEISQRAAAEYQAAAAAAAGGGDDAGVASAADVRAPAPVDPKRAEKAEKFKAKGNEAYQAGRHADAVNEYTKAINTNPQCAVYFNNRAMACIRLFRFEQAEDDCCRALAFPDLSEKDKVKALLRRATARDALQKYDDAERDLKQVLSLESNNRQAREDLQTLRAHKAEMVAAQRAMVATMRKQQMAAGGDPEAAAAVDLAAAMQAGTDPSQMPPGFDPRDVGYGGMHGGYRYE